MTLSSFRRTHVQKGHVLSIAAHPRAGTMQARGPDAGAAPLSGDGSRFEIAKNDRRSKRTMLKRLRVQAKQR